MAKPIVMNTPFLQLPAEIRNHIYTVALTHNRANDQVAAIGLLRTCKQVHREATGIFQAHSTFTIKMTCEAEDDELNPYWVDLPVWIHLGGDTTMQKVNPSVMDFADLLPAQTPQCAKFQVIVDSSRVNTSYFQAHASLNRLLYALVELLNSDSEPNRLSLKFRDSDMANAVYAAYGFRTYESTFWPLEILHRHVELQIVDWDEEILGYVQPVLNKRPHTAGATRSTIDKLREVKAELARLGIAFHTRHTKQILEDDTASYAFDMSMHRFAHKDLDERLKTVSQLA